MVDDDPELVIGKVDRPTVFVPRSPRVGTDQDDAVDLERSTSEEDRVREELVDRRPVKARVALCRGDELGYSVY